MNETDDALMRHALGLAARGLGRTWPNPAVGCVIVRGTRIVGRGWTQPGGRPHAETVALAQAGAAARGATAYVTLEPCAHHGRTPPCAEALVAAGVARVVSALEDPDARVAGRGHAILRSAGMAVSVGVGAPEAARLQRGFLTRIRAGRPMVTLKLATSFDGRIATGAGESKWITGPAARARVHLMRATHDAVLVGGGTARADDPDLTQRDLGIAHQPLRLVASARLDLPRGGRLEGATASAPLWLLHGPTAPQDARDHWTAAGARLIEVPTDPAGRLDPTGLLHTLGTEGLTRVFCEGGGQLAASLLADGLVDELIGFTAGLALGAAGTPAIAALPGGALADHPRFRLIETATLGPDLMHRWERPD